MNRPESFPFKNCVNNDSKLSHYNKGPKTVPNFQHISITIEETELNTESHKGADDEYEVFYEELKPLWTMLRVMGCYPIQKVDKGVSKFKYISWAMLYALSYIAVNCALCTVVAINLIIAKNGKPPLSMAYFIYWMMQLFLGVEPIVLAFSHWWKANEVSNLMNDWRAFQDRYYLVTRTRLHLHLRRTTTVLVLGNIAFFVICTGFLNKWSTTEKVIRSSNTIYCLIFLNSHLLLWCLLCEATKRAALALLASLKQDFVPSRRSTAQLVHEYRCLWLQLSRLTRDLGNAFCYAFGFICTVWVTNTVFSIYVLLAALIKKSNDNNAGMSMYLSFVSVTIALFCNCASWTTAAVGDSFKKGLTELQTTDKETREQLLHFDLTISNNEPTISLGGFVTVNRGLLISIYATIVTYMVVLLQYNEDAITIATTTTSST